MSAPAPAAPAARTGAAAPADGRSARRQGARRHGAGTLWLAVVVAAAALAGAALLSLAVGSRAVPPAVVLDALLRPDRSVTDHLVVLDLRLPRTVVGLVVGAALGLAGALMQGLTRNPLADPGLLGVNAGAATAVVLAISVLGVTSPSGYVWFALVGAAVAAVVVHGVAATGREGATPVKLTLAGAAVSAMLLSVTSAVLVTDSATFDQFRFWQVGSLSGRELSVVAAVLPVLLVGAVLALAMGPVLDALSLGQDVARGLGQRTGVARAVGALAAVLLCGGATAVAGPVAFLGLAVPHVVRAVTGPSHRWLLPLSALVAPTVLLLADVLGRVVARPGELQVGIVTAVVGAPVLVLLVRRRRGAVAL
ncbi:iron chelate uptake ABC transporter family permease subunit [Pseudokineococcus basanitobsidens]|uniref:Iron chelate uptake ABC transporter family permease subunit n=1 Tax=Pseudokineococcus basanitobsidens TaxID=1926649 RepID=A0ABU8RPC1_9ACTN